MKTVKIILGIIIGISVIFLATGIVVKETKYTTKIEIEKPIEEVFEKFQDTTLLKKWIPELKSFKVIDEKPGKVGSTYKMVVENNGERINMTEKILAYVPNEKITHYFDAENMLKTDEYSFSFVNNKTVLTKNSTCQSNSFLMSCVFPYFKGTLQELDQQYLNRFKKVVE